MPWALLLLAAAADPAGPPAGPVEHLHKRVVAAIRNCPEGMPGEVVVCSRDRGVAEAYRLPRLDPRFAQRAPAPDMGASLARAGAGESGFGTCSAGGASAAGGCQARLDDGWRAEKRRDQTQGVDFPW